MKSAPAVAALVAALGFAGAAQACILPGALLLAGEGYTVAAQPDPAPIEIGKLFSLTLTLCAAPGLPAGRIVAIDAQMPAHRHGMNYAPRLTPLDSARMRAEGLMLHMPGLWRLTVEIEAAGKRQLAAFDLALE